MEIENDELRDASTQQKIDLTQITGAALLQLLTRNGMVNVNMFVFRSKEKDFQFKIVRIR